MKINKKQLVNKQTHRKHRNLLLVAFIFFSILILTPIISAEMGFDNIKSYNDEVGDYGKITIKDWFGLKNLQTIELKENTEFCGSGCLAKSNSTMYEDGILIEDLRFIDLDTGRETEIKSYELYVDGEIYNFGEEVKKNSEGTEYNIELKGELYAFQRVDWQIKSQGFWHVENEIWTSDLNLNLTHYYDYDTGSGATLVERVFGTDNGDLSSGLPNWIGGLLGNALAFNDTTDVEVNIPAELFDLDEQTVAFWLRPNDTILAPSNEHIISSSQYWIIRDAGSDNLQIMVGGDSFKAEVNDSWWQPQTWMHLAVVYKTTGIDIYLNGSLQNSSSIAWTKSASENLTIGDHYQSSAGTSFSGAIDEMGFWNGTLTASQIEALYNDGIGITFNADAPALLEVSLNEPADGTLTNNTTINLTASYSFPEHILDNATYYIWRDNNTLFNKSTFDVDLLTNSTNISFSGFNSDGYIWNVVVCGNNATATVCSDSTINSTFSVDNLPPEIIINSPTGIIDFGSLSINESLNWSVSDANINSCWFNYNNINTTVLCASNLTNFTLTTQKNLTFYANDSFNNINSNFNSWDYKVLQINQTFNNLTFSSAEEIFTLDFLLGGGFSISSAFMNYNNTNHTSTILSLGDSRRLSNTINVPSVSEDTNFTFNFLIDLGSEIISSLSSKQQVSTINMTNCSGGGTVILNMSLFDERLKTSINGDIEINAQALDKNSLNNAGFSNLIYNDVPSGSVCITLTEALDNLYLDAEIKYSSDNYEPELYYIQRADLSNYPINLSLFDLLTNESTEFLVTYQDNDLILVSEAIIQLQRKYVSEDLYEVVEAPLTSDSGTAVIHVDLDTNIYRATIVKDGETLDFFDNIVFHCESELSGQCTQELLGIIDPQNDVSIESLTDFSYLISQNNDTITTAFSIPSGVPQIVNVLLTQVDQFNNTFLCNQTVFSSAGAIGCDITPTIGDSFLNLKIKRENLLQAEKDYLVQEDASLQFLGNNYFILFILMLSVVGMAFSSPEWIVINGVITMVLAGGLYLAQGVDFVVGLGNLIWLIIGAVILIYKMAHQEDR